jgi:glutamyl-tRNA synthetase
VAGRFAPSPTGQLHLGNLRTAVMAWCAARAAGVEFLIRVEDLMRIPQSVAIEAQQLDDLAALGLVSDRPILRQSERGDLYETAIDQLSAAGLIYECFCTRREIATEIAAAAAAPHGRFGDHYPGTCANLSDAQRRRRQRLERPPALRMRAAATSVTGTDLVAGNFAGVVDDFVVRRADGVAAYNLAVVLDDAAQGVTQVVRGDDLLESTPRQIYLHSVLGLDIPSYAHVPLVVGADGERLAKRHGAVNLADLRAVGRTPGHVMAGLLRSTGLVRPEIIPSELVSEIEGTTGDVDLGGVTQVLASYAARHNALNWKVTPCGHVSSDTL